jgi:hypothetical protein
MANRQLHRRGEVAPVFGTPASATVIEIGDLLFQDPVTYAPRPASNMVDQGSAALNKDSFQMFFWGVAAQASRAGDTSPIRIHTSGEHEFDCAAATFQVGGMVSVYELTTNVLGDQCVIVTLLESSAIGVVAKQYSSNTTRVLVRIRSTIMRNALQAQVVGSSSGVL